MVDRYTWVSNYENVTDSALNEHINEHWNNEQFKQLVYNASLYLISRLGIILTTCLRAGTVWPILRRKWKTLLGSCVNTTGFQMPRKAQHRVQTHWDHFCTRDHFSLGEPNHSFLMSEHHILYTVLIVPVALPVRYGWIERQLLSAEIHGGSIIL